MLFGILNRKLGIAVIEDIENLDDRQIYLLKERMPDGVGLKDLVFFYMRDRDWIMINKSHYLYEYYSEIIPVYLELSADDRRKARSAAPTYSIKNGLSILDDVIRRRLLIYGRPVCERRGGAAYVRF